MTSWHIQPERGLVKMYIYIYIDAKTQIYTCVRVYRNLLRFSYDEKKGRLNEAPSETQNHLYRFASEAFKPLHHPRFACVYVSRYIIYIHMYIYICICVCVCASLSIYIYIYIYMRGSLDKFPDFFRMGLLLIVHTWNSSPLRSNLLRLQCTFCTVPKTCERPHGSPLVWAC